MLLPRLDLPFKNAGGLRGLPRRLSRRSPRELAIRAHWRTVAESLVTAFRGRGCGARLVVHPLWRVTTELVTGLGADVVFIPHKQRFQFGPLDCRTYFYKQTIFPWLFSIDPLGWSAGSSAYPCDDRGGDPSAGTFERYVERVVNRNESKYPQPPGVGRDELVARGEVPAEPYIFFPCQQANDEAIRFFSPYKVDVVVAGLARWAGRRRVPIVFKAHPNGSSGARAQAAAARGLGAYWSTASVHDLIRHSAAVYTINSGVGFEALLHDKPVVTFGRTEYDAVTIHGDLAALDNAWEAVQSSDPVQRLTNYKRFVDWYCRLYCFDLGDPRALEARLSAVVEEAIS